MLNFISSCWTLAFVMTFAPYAIAEDPDFAWNLDGTWKSDWALTKKHIDGDCKLSNEQVIGLERLMGKMTVRYTRKQAVFTMPEIRFTKDGKEAVLEGWTSKEDLRIIGRTRTHVAVLSKAVSPPIDEDYIVLINFVDADTYWVYLGHSPLAGQHVREYFRRQTPK